MSDTLETISLWDKAAWRQVDALLEQEGVSRDANLDYTCGMFDGDRRLAATGSTFGNTLRCFAVDQSRQGEGLLNQVVSHLMDHQAERGLFHLFVYTKVNSAKFFRDLGFYEIAQVEGTLSFLENRPHGFGNYCANLTKSRREGKSAAIVMNANPFTLGHRRLVERAAEENDAVHLFVLSEDASLVPFEVRWRLVNEGVADLSNVVCHRSGPYIISSATFPSYFLKDSEAVIQGHARLDLKLFGSIAQALGVTSRYVGEEPTSQVTGLYNRVMTEELPKAGIRCVVVPRLEQGGEAVSASTVRKLIHDGRLEEVRPLVPESTWDYFTSPESTPVIQKIRESGQVVHY